MTRNIAGLMTLWELDVASHIHVGLETVAVLIKVPSI